MERVQFQQEQVETLLEVSWCIFDHEIVDAPRAERLGAKGYLHSGKMAPVMSIDFASNSSF